MRISRAISSVCAFSVLLAVHADAQSDGPRRTLRLVEEADTLHLDLAVRHFTPRDGSGPTIVLASAMHVGEPRFYASLQAELDALDLVLFESVKPPGTGDPEHDVGTLTDLQRAQITRGRIRFVAEALYRYHELQGSWPKGLAELPAGLPKDLAALAAKSLEDAWGRPLALTAAPARTKRPFDVQSLGADGALGGTGPDADLCFADQADLTDVELGASGGIQKDLADALGLVFQLDAMDHSGANWRNSDLSIDQVEARFSGTDVDTEDLFGNLRGEAFLAKAAGFVLKLVSRFSYGSAALKVLGIEVLARADELLENAPPELEEMLGVLIHARNDVVIGDLREALAQEPPPRTIGVIYGAAHMRDLEERLTTELGYSLAREEWLRAVTIDLDGLGIEREQVDLLRKTVQRTLEGGLGWR